MISGIEKSLIRVQDIAINVIKLHLANKSANEISSELEISNEVAIEIIEKFESNDQ